MNSEHDSTTNCVKQELACVEAQIERLKVEIQTMKDTKAHQFKTEGWASGLWLEEFELKENELRLLEERRQMLVARIGSQKAM